MLTPAPRGAPEGQRGQIRDAYEAGFIFLLLVSVYKVPF